MTGKDEVTYSTDADTLSGKTSDIRGEVEHVVIQDLELSGSAQRMFLGFTAMKDIKFSNFNTENVTDISYMFSGCSNLESVDFSGSNFSNVTNVNQLR